MTQFFDVVSSMAMFFLGAFVALGAFEWITVKFFKDKED